MADPRFFRRSGPFTLAQLAGLTECVLSDPSRGDRQVSDVAALGEAGEGQVSFFDNRKYLTEFEKTKAGACFVRPEFADRAPEGTVCLVSKNPYLAYARAAQAFYPDEKRTSGFCHATAVVDPTATLGRDCLVEAGVVIGRNVKIGDHCRILANAVIEEGVEVGPDSEVGANAVLSHCIVGARVKIYPGACIGQSGFGFAMGPAGFVTVPQLGRVIIEDDVEVGANTTIDRGAGPDTVIGRGTRIDNLVQIGHNVKVGRNCVIVAQTGISGSTKLEDFVMTGGQSGFAGHLTIGAGVRVAAQSGVMRDIPPKAEYMGSPAVPIKQYMRQVAKLSQIAQLRKKAGEEE